jgi:hypothetical protein
VGDYYLSIFAYLHIALHEVKTQRQGMLESISCVFRLFTAAPSVRSVQQPALRTSVKGVKSDLLGTFETCAKWHENAMGNTAPQADPSNYVDDDHPPSALDILCHTYLFIVVE